MPFSCPKCQRQILNRKRAACEWCGSELPEELLLSAEQIHKLAEQSEKEKAEHERFMKKPSNTTSIPYSSVHLFADDLFFD